MRNESKWKIYWNQSSKKIKSFKPLLISALGYYIKNSSRIMLVYSYLVAIYKSIGTMVSKFHPEKLL